MTERIDHAAEARAALKAAQMNPADADVITDPWLLAAQVHAALAGVEQQRIANRIALASAVAEASRMAGTQGSVLGLLVEEVGLFDYPDTEHGTPPLHKDIREGLGL
ncbi:hypothetical protein NS183_07860 [Microbacterium testaceum]|uniref:hypothetical protein n=1 Tax=Microbacterium testaceum TaxID=2033 RepID=UPI000734E41F|nr:hypothetical protein [Microbacterium testaceum]KTS90689.1 hypothetical protein NS183_07860 [Microbacterium testaceum]